MRIPFITTLTLSCLLISLFSVSGQYSSKENPFKSGKSSEEKEVKSEESQYSNKDNPFASGSSADNKVAPVSSELHGNNDADVPFWYPIVAVQKQLNAKLSSSLADLKNGFSFIKVFWIFIISLVYSLFHTAGPGHGKLILGTYFMTSDENRKKHDAALAGSIVSLTHIGTAFILSLIVYLLLNSLSMAVQRDMATVSRKIGGILVILTGIAIVLTTLYNKRLEKLQKRVAKSAFSKFSLIGISILSGIVPCPLAWFVLIFSISYGIYIYGIISIAGMAIGAAITVGSTGFIVLIAREKTASLLNTGLIERAAVSMRGAGGIVLVILGTIMSLPTG